MICNFQYYEICSTPFYSLSMVILLERAFLYPENQYPKKIKRVGLPCVNPFVCALLCCVLCVCRVSCVYHYHTRLLSIFQGFFLSD